MLDLSEDELYNIMAKRPQVQGRRDMDVLIKWVNKRFTIEAPKVEKKVEITAEDAKKEEKKVQEVKDVEMAEEKKDDVKKDDEKKEDDKKEVEKPEETKKEEEKKVGRLRTNVPFVKDGFRIMGPFMTTRRKNITWLGMITRKSMDDVRLDIPHLSAKFVDDVVIPRLLNEKKEEDEKEVEKPEETKKEEEKKEGAKMDVDSKTEEERFT